ncbi:MAG: dockerin type I repeat-containing protein [Ruminococcus sp.]|nr:dockerin type I repeat-containing protein [Ruminococcus sp.]
MKKITKITTVLLVANLCFPYSAVAEKDNGITIYSLYPTKDSVTDFCMWLDDIDMSSADRALLMNEKNCYWIRTIPENPDGTSIEDLWLMLYKDSNTGATLLGFEDKVTQENKVVRFIGNDGGLGVTSVALGDFNNDGWNEIYFTYSWNPDTYCSQVGYFDTKTSYVYYFGDYVCPDSELIFTSENDTLTICKAELTNYEDKVHFKLEADKSIAEIVCNDGEIEIAPLSDDFVKLEEKIEPTEKTLPDWLPKSADEAYTFMEENGGFSIKDSYICGIVFIGCFDSSRGNKICLSEKSDVKAPVSYKKYSDEYWDEFIVACFEMPPDSYLEIYDSAYKSNPHYSYISDENGKISETCKGDVNKDGQLNVADAVVLQKWLLGDGDSLGCWQNADICDDNRIDVFDICLIKSTLLKK